MIRLLNGPNNGRKNWARQLAIFAIVVLGIVALLLASRLLGLYWLYWGTSTFKEIFYEDVGLSDEWAETLALIAAVFYALAMLHLLGQSTWQFLARKFDARQFAIWFICYCTVFVAPHALRAIAATAQGIESCFDREGKSTKWYVESFNDQIVLYNSPGYDQFGTKKLPVTKALCERYRRQRSGSRPRRIAIDPRKIEYFDAITRAPRAWYSKSAAGFALYDAPGFDPTTSESLQPVTPEIVEKILTQAEISSGWGTAAVSIPGRQPTDESNRSTVDSPKLVAASLQSANEAKANLIPVPKATFEFRVCNRTTAPATIAVMGREPLAPRDWILKGWMHVDSSQCKLAGIFLKGAFFFAANSPIRRWGAPGIIFCVNRNPFRKIHNSPERCSTPQHLQNFERVAVVDDHYSWILN